MSDIRLGEAIHHHKRMLNGAIYEVERVADLLSAVGLDRAATDLTAAIAGLSGSADRIIDAHTQDVNDQIAHGEFMIGGMLKLALDGKLHPSEAKP